MWHDIGAIKDKKAFHVLKNKLLIMRLQVIGLLSTSVKIIL